jgi:folate-binding Fe-S cluster repair protein YgfZ
MANLVENETLTWSLIAARGEDAYDFCQGQLSQDLGTARDRGAWTLVLAPDSVVVSVGVVRVYDEGVDLVVPSELAESTRARLARFLLRSKCTLELRATSDAPFVTTAEQVAASWPGVREIARGLTPHAFGRHFVDQTVSFSKGCFTGQELVGRLDARGSSVPWRLVRFTAQGAEQVDAYLRSKGPEGPQGVTSAVSLENEVHGLGIAHRTLLGAAAPQGILVEEVA